MVVIQARSRRKASGGRNTSTLSKRTHMRGRPATLTKIGEKRKSAIPTKGGGHKQRLFSANTANVYNPKTKKYESAAIKAVLESPANRNFVRRSVITKNAIIQTDKGKAKITSRPGQDGVVNAILLE